MNTSLKIAIAELKTLFYSPIAWFLTIIFVFQSSLTYTSIVEEWLTKQELGGGYLRSVGYLTNNVFGFYGLYGAMVKKIFLYLPLITMGLISRETNSGTIKLLYSSPVKLKEIVGGKYIAMVFYSFLLTLVLSIFVFTSTFIIKSADTSAMLVGLFGIFMLLCTYSAIGLFMSALTTYQVVAALSTLVVFGIFSYIGTVWQDIDFIRSLTYFLSITSRTDHMTVGLLSSKDVIYFVVIIVMFLMFTFFRLQSDRKTVSTLHAVIKYSATFAMALLIGYVSSMPRFIASYDGTAVKVFTLHPNALKGVELLGDEPLEITSYINLLDPFIWQGLPNQRNTDLDRWEPYLRAKHNVTLKYVYYYDMPGKEQQLMENNPGKTLKQIAENSAKSFHMSMDKFKTPEEIRKEVDLRTENNRYVIQLKYKGKSTFLRLYNDMKTFPSETEIAAALHRLTAKSFPKIVFIESEMERGRNPQGERDYGILSNGIGTRESLINQGFDTESISLNEQEIPADASVLVIAGPRKDFSPAGMAKIQRYIEGGGNLLITGEPGKQTVINPLIKDLGVQLMDGQLVQDDDLLNAGKPKGNQGPSMGSVGISINGQSMGASNDGFTYELIKAKLTDAAASYSWHLQEPVKNGSVIGMMGATALSYVKTGPFTVQPLVVTDERVSWLKKGKLVADSGAVAFVPADGDVKGSFPTVLALNRKINGRDQRIVISGSVDLFSNGGLMRRMETEPANMALGIGLFSWFANNEFPVDTRHEPMKDNRFNLTSAGLKTIKIVYMGVLPGVLLVIGSIFLMRRKRK